ncbi:MAG: hypothetical protein EBS72_05080, partial [Rhizobiales bacterium]|nr:hypothetical protein [Hyphomicrobiales bacterium]
NAELVSVNGPIWAIGVMMNWWIGSIPASLSAATLRSLPGLGLSTLGLGGSTRLVGSLPDRDQPEPDKKR